MRALPHHQRTERGVVIIELALVMFIFLLLVIGTLEVARVMYMLNAVQDVTRVAARAAAVTDYTSIEGMAALRRHALLRADDGPLPLLPELGPGQINIEYLGQDADGAIRSIARPQCPAQNVVNCNRDPHGGSCIRLVRVSICAEPDANGACTPLAYRSLTGMVPGLNTLPVPPSATVVKAESLGFVPASQHCINGG
ncbi:TadE family protein [Pseudoduganella lutea]|uniref:Pilus assembly protein n=1 Tax=Pseudoduganella lutea TaxID=321985 RepID=A0A4P6KXU6_9BURK|nr:TadE family protein [Pseudoduganella lutea]QBE63565.1 pilus assembly protein [Pseudoduganella lutea]